MLVPRSTSSANSEERCRQLNESYNLSNATTEYRCYRIDHCHMTDFLTAGECYNVLDMWPSGIVISNKGREQILHFFVLVKINKNFNVLNRHGLIQKEALILSTMLHNNIFSTMLPVEIWHLASWSDSHIVSCSMWDETFRPRARPAHT